MPVIWLIDAYRAGERAQVRALVDALEASFHSRIRYPWQEKKPVPQKKTGWRIGAFDEKNSEDRAFRP